MCDVEVDKPFELWKSRGLGLQAFFGSAGPPGSYADMESTDVVLLIGSNIADNHPILCTRVGEGPGKRPGRTLIVVDPRVTKTATMADIHLAIKPRADIALINGIAHVLFAMGLRMGNILPSIRPIMKHLRPMSPALRRSM